VDRILKREPVFGRWKQPVCLPRNCRKASAIVRLKGLGIFQQMSSGGRNEARDRYPCRIAWIEQPIQIALKPARDLSGGTSLLIQEFEAAVTENGALA